MHDPPPPPTPGCHPPAPATCFLPIKVGSAHGCRDISSTPVLGISEQGCCLAVNLLYARHYLNSTLFDSPTAWMRPPGSSKLELKPLNSEGCPVVSKSPRHLQRPYGAGRAPGAPGQRRRWPGLESDTWRALPPDRRKINSPLLNLA